MLQRQYFKKNYNKNCQERRSDTFVRNDILGKKLIALNEQQRRIKMYVLGIQLKKMKRINPKNQKSGTEEQKSI